MSGQIGKSSTADNLGKRVLCILGEPAVRELLDLLEQSDSDRAALIGRLYGRDDATWLAELLMDLEDDEGELARLALLKGLQAALGESRGS